MNRSSQSSSSLLFFFTFLFCFLHLGSCFTAFPDHYVKTVPQPVRLDGWTEYFEVAPPLPTQHLIPTYSLLLLKYDFKNTTGLPAVTVPYNPPFECPTPWLAVVLQVRGACQGVQDDRIVGIWLEGVEILRTSTAQPTETGVFWKIEKDVTKYNSLLVRSNLTLTLMLENTINEVLTGFYHVEVSLLYYGLWLLDEKSDRKVSMTEQPRMSRRLASWTEDTNTETRTVEEGQTEVKLELVKGDVVVNAASDGVDKASDVKDGQSEVKLELVKGGAANAASDGGDDGSSYFEKSDSDQDKKKEISPKEPEGQLESTGNFNIFYDRPADLIIPIVEEGSRGYWFKIKNESIVHSKEILVPRNAYRAVLEIYVSFHHNDEFWYSNPPTSYIIANNLTTERGNGAFRQIFVTIDDLYVGCVEPFPVIYSGGINPLLWETVVGIGSFELPTYDLELTPFLGVLLDGNGHFIRLGVKDAISYWLVDANLHLWLDPYSPVVFADTILYRTPDLELKRKTKFKLLDGKFKVQAERKTRFSGWVCYSAGNFTTQVEYEFKFKNNIEVEKQGQKLDVEQSIKSRTELKVQDSKRHGSRTVGRIKSRYPLRVRIATTPGLAFDTFLSITNVSNAMEVKSSLSLPNNRLSSTLSNSQVAGGWLVARDHFALSGTGNIRQKLKYKDWRNCYSQTVSASAGMILENKVTTICETYYS